MNKATSVTSTLLGSTRNEELTKQHILFRNRSSEDPSLYKTSHLLVGYKLYTLNKRMMRMINLSALLLLLGAVQMVLSASLTEMAILSVSPTESAMSTLMEVVKAIPKTTTSHRAKRSVPLTRLSAEQFNQCQAVANKESCKSGGLQEQLYTLAKECRRDDLASTAQFSCGVNADGLYCGQGLEIADQYGSAVQSCFSGTSCSSTCMSAVNSINNTLGCCSGHWTRALSGQASILSGSLWSSCGVNPGPLCPIPMFNSSVTDTRNCSLNEANQILFAHRCRRENSGAVEVLANTTGCSTVAKVHVEICQVDSNGTFCSFNPGTSTALRFVQNCASSQASSSCSASCRSSMIALRTEIGCCINTLYNGTLARVAPVSMFNQVLPYFTNSFWSRCGVDTPGTCESTLVLPDHLADRDNGSVRLGGVLSMVILLGLTVGLY